MTLAPHRIDTHEIAAWVGDRSDLAVISTSIGARAPDPSYVEDVLSVEPHIAFVVRELSARSGTAPMRGAIPSNALDSIPFYSLCKGLFLPLARLNPARAAQIFGVRIDPPPGAEAREALVKTFLQKDVGLSLELKIGCLLGDPYLGKPGTFRRASLLRLVLSTTLSSRRDVLNRLRIVGDEGILLAEARPALHMDPPLTAAEVLYTLRFLPNLRRREERFQLLQTLHARTGKLEAYFLAKLAIRKAGFGFDYEGPLLARALAERFGAPEEEVKLAMTLTDAHQVARTLDEEGAGGLKRIHLQPLVPVRPALAGGTADECKKFPVLVERKYDGIRLMLHKTTDAGGNVLAAAYTRTRKDWLELCPGLDATIKLLPARSLILDGELHGIVQDRGGPRPATVYEVSNALQGEPRQPIALRYAAFDILYAEGQDLTSLPLGVRRQRVSALVAPLSRLPLAVPVASSEAQLASTPADLNRLYAHFRAQGYEGIVAKDPDAPYALAVRDPTWMKRKPAITLDLVILAAVYAVTTKERAGLFGSYVLGAKTASGTFEDVGDVAGVDQMRDQEIQQEIVGESLITGRRVERPTPQGPRQGLELRPHIVVTVRFEGLVKDYATGALHLRDPKIVALRTDKSPYDANTLSDLETLELRSRMG